MCETHIPLVFYAFLLCFMQLEVHLEAYMVGVKENQAHGILDTLISGTDESAVNNDCCHRKR